MVLGGSVVPDTAHADRYVPGRLVQKAAPLSPRPTSSWLSPRRVPPTTRPASSRVIRPMRGSAGCTCAATALRASASALTGPTAAAIIALSRRRTAGDVAGCKLVRSRRPLLAWRVARSAHRQAGRSHVDAFRAIPRSGHVALRRYPVKNRDAAACLTPPDVTAAWRRATGRIRRAATSSPTTRRRSRSCRRGRAGPRWAAPAVPGSAPRAPHG